MKKDSFTFSDKLKKSKSLPLSKRIPSRSSGEVKAKRTLFERAQRDLPFIIVAALALLLLPFLSRESVDIETPSVVWGDGDAYMEDFNQPKSAEGEIALSSFRNPLDLIIRHGDKDASRDTIDTDGLAYGSGEGSSSEGYGSSRSSYSSEDYSSAPATSSYGKTVRRSVRNSINRVPTAIGSLRAGSMVSPGAGSGVGHSMAVGSRSKEAGPKVQGPGVRPVALQPLTAAGKGRDLTGGDALYAEAARSIGAMNRPGAKQALLESQLADVDGKPLGEAKGGPGPGDPNRPGANGGPSNSWSHNNQKPWWWDMMSDRAQKRWMLWHYNWEKMASDSLIKLTAGLASCLLTGSNDFAVNKFLGEAGSSRTIPCCTANGGATFCADQVEDFSTSKISAGKDQQEQQNNAVHALTEMCGEGAIWSTKEDFTARKSALDVRLRCLGLKLSELKEKIHTNYAVGCAEVDSTPMALTVNVTKNGKVKSKKLEKMGYYIVAELPRTGRIINPTQDGHLEQCATDRVIFIDKLPAMGGRIVIDNDKILKEYPGYQIKKVVVYKVGKKKNSDKKLSEAEEEYNKMLTYTSEQQKEYNRKHGGKGAYEKKLNKLQEELAKQTDLANGRTLNEATKDEVTLTKDLETVDDAGYFDTQETVDVTISEEEYESAFTLIRGRIKNKECVTEDFVRYKFKPWKGKLEQVQVCPVAPKLLNVNIDGQIGGVRCFSTATTDYKANKLVAGQEYAFQADVIEPTRRVLAFVLERYNTQTGYEDWRVVDTFDTHSKEIKLSEEKFLSKVGDYTFAGTVTVGIGKDGRNKVGEDATPGEGKIVWIATDDVYGQVLPNIKGSSADVSELFRSSAPRQVGVCRYSWGCEKVRGKDVCSQQNGCCKGLDGNPYNATYVDGWDGIPLETAEACDTPYTEEQLERLPPCEKICEKAAQYLLEEHPRLGFATREELEAAGVNMDKCSHCNEDIVPGGEKRSNADIPVVPGTPSNGDLICQEGGVPCPCIKVDPHTSPATPDPLYIRSGLNPKDPTGNMPEVTPICRMKRDKIEKGDIYVRDPDNNALEQVIPDDDIVKMLQEKQQENPGEVDKLCPVCNPKPGDGDDGGDSCPLAPGKVTKNGPCQVIVSGEFFTNASYKICQPEELKAELDWVYDYMKGCENPVIEGHASKIYVTGGEPNNKRISFDRALEVSKYVRDTWETKGEDIVSINPYTDNDGNYEGDTTHTERKSWPDYRNTIKNPIKSGSTITFAISGVGSQYAPVRRPSDWKDKVKKGEVTEDYYRNLEIPDRKVIIKGTPIKK